MTATSATEAASRWIGAFDAALSRADVSAALELFAPACFWRDILSFTWNIKTMEGRADIGAMLRSTLDAIQPRAWRIIEQPAESNGVVEVWIDIETSTARNRGLLRLRDGKCWTLLTTMLELKGFEEAVGRRRDMGVTHEAVKGRKSWLERTAERRAALGTTEQPYCVVIGGGQGGLAVGARLQCLNVPTIILDRNARAGDAWRHRYKSLVLHDPVWLDHLPYLPFPAHWPIYTPKDRMADWLEAYCKLMDLNYWTSSECLSAHFDDANQEWVVTVRRGGEDLVLRPKQLVFATGLVGPPKDIRLPGSESFRGEIFHSSAYEGGAAYRGKKCIVIGSGTSAHDVCVDLWEHDADVTMIQRSATIVVKSRTLREVGFEALYSESALERGISTEKADLIAASMPFRLMADLQIPMYEDIARRDADLYQRLTKAGFLVGWGEDRSGLVMQAYRTASGFYIDVGGSELIARGDVKVKGGVGVAEIRPDSVALTDGTALPADLIVCAIGYQPMTATVGKIISPEAAERIGSVWGYGAGVGGDPGPWQGELRNLWKPLPLPALWYHGGNLGFSRQYSRYIALQIKARMEGIPTPVYQ